MVQEPWSGPNVSAESLALLHVLEVSGSILDQNADYSEFRNFHRFP
jgi:hypothetical protein